MLVILIPVVIVLIAVVAAAIAATSRLRRERAHADRLREEPDRILRYQVPNGQDPVAVVIELKSAGYDAVADPTVGQVGELLISCPGGAEPAREDVRNALAKISRINMEGDDAVALPPIRFVDE